MSQDKAASKRKRRSKAAPLLGAAGLSLTLASGASAAIHSADGGHDGAAGPGDAGNHARRGRAFRREPCDIPCLRQGECCEAAARPAVRDGGRRLCRLRWLRRLRLLDRDLLYVAGHRQRRLRSAASGQAGTQICAPGQAHGSIGSTEYPGAASGLIGRPPLPNAPAASTRRRNGVRPRSGCSRSRSPRARPPASRH